MRLACATLIAALSLAPAGAQTVIEGDNSTFRLSPPRKDVTTLSRAEVSAAPAAVLRGLDKLSGTSSDLPLETGETQEFGRLTITMRDCRYPKNNPNGDAFVYLTIEDEGVTTPVFDGWMIASSPALSALDHPRYDVWVIRCKLDNRTPAVVAGESSPRPIMRPEGLGGNSRG